LYCSNRDDVGIEEYKRNVDPVCRLVPNGGGFSYYFFEKSVLGMSYPKKELCVEQFASFFYKEEQTLVTKTLK
jgi:hypothetical protein